MADIQIDGNAADQQAVRFAIYHLRQSNPEDDHRSISACGMTGDHYWGHVFWDTEMYISPHFIYTEPETAKKSIHRGLVAPPTMMQAWTLRGLAMAKPQPATGDKQLELHTLLTEYGYPSVVATNTEQGYTRYLRPGDRISTTTVIESISEQKSTALGIGYFINTRDTIRDQNGEEVGWITFRVLKFKPHQQPAAATSSDSATPTMLMARRTRGGCGVPTVSVTVTMSSVGSPGVPLLSNTTE